MELSIENVEYNDESLYFNWVRCSGYKSADDGGSECMIDLKIRVPKNIDNLIKIQEYVDYKIPIILKEIIEEV